MASAIVRLFEENNLKDIQYVEPFGGGASLALTFLFEEYASVIHINDLSRPVYSFWNSVLNRTQELCERIEETPINMEVWEQQRQVYDNRNSADLLDLGFATLFLNRTNRSGIISGGPIGGKRQGSAWTLNCRFNKQELVQRIERISRYRGRIRLHNRDALELTTNLLPTLGPDAFIFYDPPYIERGKDLYLNEYTWEDHQALADKVNQTENPWVVTYDYHAAVQGGLYPHAQRLAYDLAYTTQDKYYGKEVMFLSRRMKLPTAWEVYAPFNMASKRSAHPFYGVVERVPCSGKEKE